MLDTLEERLKVIESKIELACSRSGRSRKSVDLIAVTKTHPFESIQKLIDLGVTQIGENRVDEIEEKAPRLHGIFTMHMIGHLQTNKVNRVLPYVRWIQSIDRDRLIDKIERAHTGEPIMALVEVNTSGEVSKSGCSPAECIDLCERVAQSKAFKFRGLMTIGPLQGGEIETRKAFTLLRELGGKVRHLSDKFELSMGMSGDFEWAIEEGSTMVRIGSSLMGART